MDRLTICPLFVAPCSLASRQTEAAQAFKPRSTFVHCKEKERNDDRGGTARETVINERQTGDNGREEEKEQKSGIQQP